MQSCEIGSSLPSGVFGRPGIVVDAPEDRMDGFGGPVGVGEDVDA